MCIELQRVITESQFRSSIRKRSASRTEPVPCGDNRRPRRGHLLILSTKRLCNLKKGCHKKGLLTQTFPFFFLHPQKRRKSCAFCYENHTLICDHLTLFLLKREILLIMVHHFADETFRLFFHVLPLLDYCNGLVSLIESNTPTGSSALGGCNNDAPLAVVNSKESKQFSTLPAGSGLWLTNQYYPNLSSSPCACASTSLSGLSHSSPTHPSQTTLHRQRPPRKRTSLAQLHPICLVDPIRNQTYLVVGDTFLESQPEGMSESLMSTSTNGSSVPER
jgi:hypothetical protein